MKQMKRFLSVLLCSVLLLFLCLPAGALFSSRPDPAQPFENSAFFDYEDYRIHYRAFPAENPKGQIFLMHGFALSSYCFLPLAEELVAAGYSCVLADLPDFGYSSRETAETRQLPREEVMHALMQHLSPDPWFVAGHSMGGFIALGLAARYPESVKNLLLYGTSGNDSDVSMPTFLTGNPTLVNAYGGLLETAGKSKLLVRLLYVFACNSLPFALRYDVSKITDPYYIPGTGAGVMRNVSMLPKTDYALVETMPPILFLNGDRDYVIADNQRVTLREHLPQGSVDYVIPGAGHMVMETHAKESAEATLAFLWDK